MIITDVLTATNTHSLYYKMIPLFVKAWNKILPGAKIHIIIICDQIPDEIKNYDLIQVAPLKNISTGFTSQFIRLLYPGLLNSEGGVLITDMDMIPMNRSYYLDSIKDISTDKFVSYRDVLLHERQLPVCYNVAHSYLWAEIFDIKTMTDLVKTLQTEYGQIEYSDIHGGKGWSADQIFLYKKAVLWHKQSGNLMILNDDKTGFNRLDRCMNIELTPELKFLIRHGCFSDYHMKRPYDDYKELNDGIIDALIL
ncbi:MAG: hypothetical protein GY754_16835 [bacterium]|nr:hypothetical protein [bacterium]